MKINRKFLKFTLLVLVGIAIGAILLFFKPNLGKKIGGAIYSSSVPLEGYSYAVNKAAPCVVNIYVANFNEDYTEPDASTITTSASGVVMTDGGYIVTNYHVVALANEPSKGIWIQTREGKVYKAFVVGCDRRTDIAVLKVEGAKLSSISLSKRLPNIGEIVLAIGNPNNLGQTVTHGIVSALARSGTGLLTSDKMDLRQGIQDLIQTDAPINQGNSGGALIDTQGNLVGINTASFNFDNSYGIGFAVPVNLVTQVMQEIIVHGKVERGYLGISDAPAKSLTEQKGVVIGFIDPQGPAFGILKIGDIITKVDDNPISDVKQLIGAISNSKPGKTLKLEIQRNQKILTVQITLIEDKTYIDR